MSYSRFGCDGSDVYTFQSESGFECCGCILSDNWSFKTRSDLLAHLQTHVEAGHTVPRYTIERLEEELIAEGDV